MIFIQLKHYRYPKILEKDSKFLFFTNKSQKSFSSSCNSNLHLIFSLGKLSSFLSQEIIKQKLFIESKQNKGTDSSPVSEVAEVGSCIRFPNKNKAGLYSEQQQHGGAPLAGWVPAACWEQSHTARAIWDTSPANKGSVFYKSKNQLFYQQHGLWPFKSMWNHSLRNLNPLTTPVWWSISISVVLSHQNGQN